MDILCACISVSVCVCVCVCASWHGYCASIIGEGSIASSLGTGIAERSGLQSGFRFLYTCQPKPLATLTLVGSKVLAHVAVLPM